MSPHGSRAPGRRLENDLRAVFDHCPQKWWAFKASLPRTGGYLRMAAPEAQQLHLKTEGSVEASSIRLRGEVAQGSRVVWVGK